MAAENKEVRTMKKRSSIIIALFAALAMVMAMSVSVFATGISSESEALQKALKNAGLKKSEVKNIETDYENGKYEVEFTKKKNGKKYDYDISAETGNIIKKSAEYRYKKNSSHDKIGKKAARKKVAKFSGISYKIICTGTCTYEYDDREGIYEVKFVKGSRSYEYDVLAPTGKIIEYEWKVTGN